MSWRRNASLLVVTFAFAAAFSRCTGPAGAREICANGLDDDGNGQIDCADIDCAGQAACTVDAGYFGPCKKCGSTCAAQTQCVEQSFVLDRPVASCQGGRCQSFNRSLQVNFQLDLSAYNGIAMGLFGSIDFRFVSKLAIDGTAVTCAVLEQATRLPDGGFQATDSTTLEKSGRFNVLAVDAYPLQKQPSLPVSFVNSATGDSYLIWLETWTGPRDPDSKMPTGRRIGSGCIESGVSVAPLTAADDCNPTLDAGNAGCRTIHYDMPAPNP